ncbi:MAG: hypothetical protein R3C14_30285 [Caldilineaceae bacterium]
MNQQPGTYRIYLLTIWQPAAATTPSQLANVQQRNERRDGAWCFTVEDPRTGQRRSFNSVVALAAALQAEFPEAQVRDE